MTHQAIESDAEWIGVDFEFGGAATTTTTTTPSPRRPGLRPRPIPRPSPPGPKHDAPEREPSSPKEDGGSMGVVAGTVGGVLGVILLLLVVYMLVLRRKLSKAKNSGRASSYQLRVADVAHLSHLDETSNTYVNTTDLQKLVASVRAKDKSSEGRLPTPPRLLHQTPAPYRPAAPEPAQQGDALVLRAPMPPPHPAVTPVLHPPPQAVQEEAMYSNLQECAAPPLKAPKISPLPPPPVKEPKPAVTQPARRAPAPPKASSPAPQESDIPSLNSVPAKPSATPQASDGPNPAHRVKPVPPPAAPKPGKITGAGAKPPPPKMPLLPKPGKGRGLPPLKMALHGAGGAATPDTACSTPDTATSMLSPAATPPAGQPDPGVGSISAKIAMLEGHMRTAGGAAPWVGGVRP